MYAVIFKATVERFDEEYFAMAERLRQLAFERYGCRNFDSYTEGSSEVAISYWASLEQIQAWKSDPVHQAAQQAGQRRWYSSYQVQVVELLREYDFTATTDLNSH